MGRIIINYDDKEVTPISALFYIWRVMEKGRISRNDTCFCIFSEFNDGSIVYADRTAAGTDTFTLCKRAFTIGYNTIVP